MFQELKTAYIGKKFLGKLWLPPGMWSVIRRCCWILGIGETPETPRSVWNRAAKAAEKILRHFAAEETMILVSHGWFMILLAFYLRRRRLIERGPLVPNTGFGALTEYRLRPV